MFTADSRLQHITNELGRLEAELQVICPNRRLVTEIHQALADVLVAIDGSDNHQSEALRIYSAAVSKFRRRAERLVYRQQLRRAAFGPTYAESAGMRQDSRRSDGNAS